MTDTPCDSCGRLDDPVEAVQRVYVTPADWDREEKVEIVDEVEHWCVACQTHYPHRRIDGGDDRPAGDEGAGG